MFPAEKLLWETLNAENSHYEEMMKQCPTLQPSSVNTQSSLGVPKTMTASLRSSIFFFFCLRPPPPVSSPLIDNADLRINTATNHFSSFIPSLSFYRATLAANQTENLKSRGRWERMKSAYRSRKK